MSVSAIQSVSFKGANNQPTAFQDFREVKPYQSAAQKPSVQEAQNSNSKTGGREPLRLTSIPFATGLGQYVDDRNASAKKYFLRGVGALVATGVGIGGAIVAASKGTKAGAIVGGVVALAGITGTIVNKVRAMKDAYQGEKAPKFDANA